MSKQDKKESPIMSKQDKKEAPIIQEGKIGKVIVTNLDKTITKKVDLSQNNKNRKIIKE